MINICSEIGFCRVISENEAGWKAQRTRLIPGEGHRRWFGSKSLKDSHRKEYVARWSGAHQ